MHIAIIGSKGYPFVNSGYETFVKELSERLIIIIKLLNCIIIYIKYFKFRENIYMKNYWLLKQIH